MTKRPHIPLKVQLATALLQIPGPGFGPLINYEHSKQMGADQIISLFHLDHCPIPKAEGGPDEPWNLTWRLIRAHREKTAKTDIPAIAKGKRIRRKQAEHRAKMDIEDIAEIEAITRAYELALQRKPKIPSRGFVKGHRPLRSRNTFQRRKT